MNKTLLIYGMPSLGKSTLIRELSKDFNAQIIHIDSFWKEISNPIYNKTESEFVFDLFLIEYMKQLKMQKSLILLEGVFATKSKIRLLEQLSENYNSTLFKILLYDSIENIIKKNRERFQKEGKHISKQALIKLYNNFETFSLSTYSYNMANKTTHSIYSEIKKLIL